MSVPINECRIAKKSLHSNLTIKSPINPLIHSDRYTGNLVNLRFFAIFCILRVKASEYFLYIIEYFSVINKCVVPNAFFPSLIRIKESLG